MLINEDSSISSPNLVGVGCMESLLLTEVTPTTISYNDHSHRPTRQLHTAAEGTAYAISSAAQSKETEDTEERACS